MDKIKTTQENQTYHDCVYMRIILMYGSISLL